MTPPKSLLLRLLSHSKKAEKAMRKLGIITDCQEDKPTIIVRGPIVDPVVENLRTGKKLKGIRCWWNDNSWMFIDEEEGGAP